MCFNILSPVTISNVFNTTPKTITNKGKKKLQVKTLHATVYIAQIDIRCVPCNIHSFKVKIQFSTLIFTSIIKLVLRSNFWQFNKPHCQKWVNQVHSSKSVNNWIHLDIIYNLKIIILIKQHHLSNDRTHVFRKKRRRILSVISIKKRTSKQHHLLILD